MARWSVEVIPWRILQSLPSFLNLLSSDWERRNDRLQVEAIAPRSLEENGEESVKKEETSESMYSAYIRLRMPFHWIPNVSSFEVELRAGDWLFEAFGMKKSDPSKVKLKNWRTGGANRYLFKQYKNMLRAREAGDMQEFWRIGMRLMKSKTYRLSAFNYVLHNWHRELSMKETLKIWKRVESLVKEGANGATEIDYRRVYIPKQVAGEWRPLGVPTKAWRVYLHMLNNLIVWSRINKEGSQHAYQPQRGVHTAWAEILREQDKWDYIYEFDLRKFFDNVRLEYIFQRQVKSHNYPRSIAAHFRKLNRSIVKLTSKDLISEPERHLSFTANLEPNPNKESKTKKEEKQKVNPTTLRGPSTQMHDPSQTLDLARKVDESYEKGAEAIKKWRAKYASIFPELESAPAVTPEFLMSKSYKASSDLEGNRRNHTEVGWKEYGVPQGAATSCSMAIIANEVESFTRTVMTKDGKEITVKCVFYADDGVLFSNSPEGVEHLNNKKAGIEMNKDKSSWLKYGGKWVVKSYKFLGLRYILPTETTYSSSFYNWAWICLVIEASLLLMLELQIGIMEDIIFIRGYILLVRVLWELKSSVTLSQSEEIEASTRKGATLRFDERHKFLAWLESSRLGLLTNYPYNSGDDPVYEGSAKHLNTRPPEKVRSWVWEELGNFHKYATPARLLFNKTSGIFLNRMYCNSWEMDIPQDFSMRPKAGSWVRKHGPGYLFKQRLWAQQQQTKLPERLNIFNSSSFACSDLLNGKLEKSSLIKYYIWRQRRNKPKASNKKS